MLDLTRLSQYAQEGSVTVVYGGNKYAVDPADYASFLDLFRSLHGNGQIPSVFEAHLIREGDVAEIINGPRPNGTPPWNSVYAAPKAGDVVFLVPVSKAA